MRSLILLLFFVGIILIIIDNNNNCPPPRIEYRYIPQTFEQQQMEQMPIMSTYGKLFTKATPWEKSIGYPGIFRDKKEEF